MRIAGIILTLLVIIIGIAFSALNAKAVGVNYLIGSADLPLVVLLLISLVLGALLTALFMGFNLIKVMAKKKWLETKLKHAEEKLAKLQQ